MKKIITIILLSSLILVGVTAFNFLNSQKNTFSTVPPQKEPKEISSQNSNKNQDQSGSKRQEEQSSSPSVLANLAQNSPIKGEEDGQTNILILGSSGEPHPSPQLTDSILIGILDYDQEKIKAISIPRDLAVKNENGRFQKINSIYKSNLELGEQKALERTKRVCERITGLDLHFGVKINLNTVKTVVNELGGINIEITEDIHDPAYPGPNYSYQEFELEEGWRYLNGEQAVKFIRTRHSPRGDFDRIKRQKALLAALYLKVEELGPLKKFRKLLALRKNLAEDLSTDLSLGELKRLFFHRDKFDLESLKVYQLDTVDNALLRSTHMDLGEARAYVLLPQAGSKDYSDIHDWFEKKF